MRRHYYTTPSNYLELIKLYKTMLEERKDKINKKEDRISNGLQVVFTGLTLMKICDINAYLQV
jgi:dynein heavy chain